MAQDKAITLEQACMRALRGYDYGEVKIGQVIDCLEAYEQIFDGRKSYREAYRETLEDAPWKTCTCGICGKAGINVVIFRGIGTKQEAWISIIFMPSGSVSTVN